MFPSYSSPVPRRRQPAKKCGQRAEYGACGHVQHGRVQLNASLSLQHHGTLITFLHSLLAPRHTPLQFCACIGVELVRHRQTGDLFVQLVIVENQVWSTRSQSHIRLQSSPARPLITPYTDADGRCRLDVAMDALGQAKVARGAKVDDAERHLAQ